MNGSFNGQILVDKLVKLNNTQQSIETLSHWCIFHRNKAKEVVETWQRQFYCAPRDQRISFLYLANDILQNSRRKGLEFINEFWRVLPDALIDVLNNGADVGRNTVLRLIDIWDERKVFGSHGHILKDDILGSNSDSRNKKDKGITYKLKQYTGEDLEKLVSGYNHVYGFPFDEDTLIGNCQASLNVVERMKKQLGNGCNPNDSEAAGELHKHNELLRECIEQLKAIESSRATLVSDLREALHQQESKFEQLHQQVKAAQTVYERSVNFCNQINSNISSLDQRLSEPSAFSDAPSSITVESSASGLQTTTTRFSHEGPSSDDNLSVSVERNQKAAVAASPAKMPSCPLTSLSSNGLVGHKIKEDHPDNKRLKLEDNVPSYFLPPQPPLQPPLPPVPHPDLLNQLPQPPSPVTPRAPTIEPSTLLLPPPPPPPPSLPPTPPPPPPPPLPGTPQFMPITSGATTNMPFLFGPPPPFLNYLPYPGALNPHHGFQASEVVNTIGQPPLPTAPPTLTRQ